MVSRHRIETTDEQRRIVNRLQGKAGKASRKDVGAYIETHLAEVTEKYRFFKFPRRRLTPAKNEATETATETPTPQ